MVLVPSEAAKLLVGFITTVYSIPLVSGLGWRGIRFTSIEANPLARVRDTLEASLMEVEETKFWRQRKMNSENIFILPNYIGEGSRDFLGGIFITIPKVTSAPSSLRDCPLGTAIEEVCVHLVLPNRPVHI